MSVPISNVTRRVVYAASGTGPYAFTFEILAATDIEVYKGDTLLTLTTDYSVTINVNGTGSVTLVATAGTDNITIIGARAIQRTSDFVTGGDFFANTVNTELDSLTIFAQQNAEGLARSLQAPETDPTTINMTLPRAADRADKFLAFDSDGNPVPGAVPDEIQDVLAISDEIIAVAAIDTDITAVANLSTDQLSAVASVTSDIQTLATISADIVEIALLTTDQLTAIASTTTEIASLATITSDISAVAAISTSDIAALVALDTADLAAVATVTSDIAAISPLTVEIQAVAALNTDQLSAISNVTSEIVTLAPVSSSIAALGVLGTAQIAALNTADIATLAPISADISTVASIDSEVVTVASFTTDQISTIATNVADITNFSDVYQGPKSSDPATRNDTTALQEGDLYFNTSDDSMKVYTGAAWVAAYVSGDGFLAASNNLSDLTNAATARQNLDLEIGVDVQAYDADTAKTDVAQSFTAQQTFKEVKDTVHTISDGAAFEIDPANGSIQVVTLGASRTPAATNFEAGQVVLLGIDDGSAYTITWSTVNPTWVKVGGTGVAPTLATTGYTWVLLWKVSTTVYATEVGQP